MLLILLTAPGILSAEPRKQIFLNLFYVEYAAVSAEHCHAKGFPSRSIHSSWYRDHQQIHKKMKLAAAKEYSQAGISPLMAGEEMEKMTRTYQQMAEVAIRKNPPPCRAFREFLVGFQDLDGSLLKLAP
jgi:hypothetical protein